MLRRAKGGHDGPTRPRGHKGSGLGGQWQQNSPAHFGETTVWVTVHQASIPNKKIALVAGAGAILVVCVSLMGLSAALH